MTRPSVTEQIEEIASLVRSGIISLEQGRQAVRAVNEREEQRLMLYAGPVMIPKWQAGIDYGRDDSSFAMRYAMQAIAPRPTPPVESDEDREERVRQAAIAASPIRALCGPCNGYTPAVMRHEDREHRVQFRCLACHKRLTGEASPSAVAAAPERQRDTFADLCSEWDLLPDVRR